jgi:Bacteriophage Sf6, terminase small subunit-like
MAGRPNSKYRPELAERICELIVEGFTLRQIEPEIGVSKRTILRWLAKEPDFRRIYGQAYELWAEATSHEIIDIANDGSNDWVDRETTSGRLKRVVDHEAVHRSKLRVDTLKWLMAHRAPKRWGDAMKHTGPSGDDPVQVEHGSFVEHQRRAKEEIDKAFPERGRQDESPLPPPPPPVPAEQEPEHVIRNFAKDGPREDGVAQLPTRYWRPPRILGEWSG